MSFDNINKIVSLLLFFTMITTFVGTLVLYAYYKISEQKRKSAAKPIQQIEAPRHSIAPIVIMTEAASIRPETARRRIRFG